MATLRAWIERAEHRSKLGRGIYQRLGHSDAVVALRHKETNMSGREEQMEKLLRDNAIPLKRLRGLEAGGIESPRDGSEKYSDGASTILNRVESALIRYEWPSFDELKELVAFARANADTRPSCGPECQSPAILADPVPTPQTRPSERGEKI